MSFDNIIPRNIKPKQKENEMYDSIINANFVYGDDYTSLTRYVGDKKLIILSHHGDKHGYVSKESFNEEPIFKKYDRKLRIRNLHGSCTWNKFEWKLDDLVENLKKKGIKFT